eukprot:s1434_g10.t2
MYRGVRRLLQSGGFGLIDCLDGLAKRWQSEGHHFWAEKAFRGTLLVRKALLPSEHPEVSRSLQNLAAVLQRRGSLAQAENLYRQVLAARSGRLGAEHPLTLSSLDNLGTVLQGQDKGHLVTLACMSNLAMALQSQDQWLEATELHHQVLLGRRLILGAGHISSLASLSNWTKALDTLETMLGSHHPDFLGCQAGRENFLAEAAALGEAAACKGLQQRVSIVRTVLGSRLGGYNRCGSWKDY